MSIELLVVLLVAFAIGYWAVNRSMGSNRGGHADESARPAFNKTGENHDENRQRRSESDDREKKASGAGGRATLMESWYEVLGVREDATPEEIRNAYREKISLYHPDKVVRLGPEIQAIATEQSSKINVAYMYASART